MNRNEMLVMCTSTIAVAIIACVGFVTDSYNKKEEVKPTTNYNYLEQRLQDDENAHDWERSQSQDSDFLCKYIIVECVSVEGEDTYHYVDDYTRNVDHSITFIGEDGLLMTVHYPYFQIIVNPKTKN